LVKITDSFDSPFFGHVNGSFGVSPNLLNTIGGQKKDRPVLQDDLSGNLF
jgi:hypothetical protein